MASTAERANPRPIHMRYLLPSLLSLLLGPAGDAQALLPFNVTIPTGVGAVDWNGRPALVLIGGSQLPAYFFPPSMAVHEVELRVEAFGVQDLRACAASNKLCVEIGDAGCFPYVQLTAGTYLGDLGHQTLRWFEGMQLPIYVTYCSYLQCGGCSRFDPGPPLSVMIATVNLIR